MSEVYECGVTEGHQYTKIHRDRARGSRLSYQSSKTGMLNGSDRSLRTIMASLACRHPSPATFKLLTWLVNDYVTLSDSVAAEGMKALSNPSSGGLLIMCGESSGANMGLMLKAGDDKHFRNKLDLDEHSHVVLFGCEGRKKFTLFVYFIPLAATQQYPWHANSWSQRLQQSCPSLQKQA